MAFKSEEGFKKFGFVPGLMSMTLSFQKGAFGFWVKPDKTGELEVSGEIRGETQAIRIKPFTFPKEMPSLRHWAAYMARGVFGDEAHFAKVRTLNDDQLPPGLRNLFETGFRYANLIAEPTADAQERVPLTGDMSQADANEGGTRSNASDFDEKGDAMNKSDFCHADIDDAFEFGHRAAGRGAQAPFCGRRAGDA